MPVSRQIVPEGAPAQIFEYFRKNPGRTIRSIVEDLQLDLSTAYYGLTRLHDLGLVKRIGRKRPARWEAIETLPEPSEPVPLVPGSQDGPIRLFSSQPVYAPTGMPYKIVDGVILPRFGAVEAFVIGGARIGEKEYSKQGTAHDHNADHPWSYSNRHKRAA